MERGHFHLHARVLANRGSFPISSLQDVFQNFVFHIGGGRGPFDELQRVGNARRVEFLGR